MAAFNFPSSPSNGQTYSANGVTFTYNSTSTAWVRSSGVGAQGAQGHQGHQGAAGAQGAQGNAGAQGAQGNAGAQGHQGHQGAAGAQGAQGNAGAQGAQGNAGAQGAQGSAGSATISNNADNRVITGGSGTNLVGEANLTYNGSILHNQISAGARNDFSTSADGLIIEKGGNTGLSIDPGSSGVASIYFPNESNHSIASISHNNSSGELRVRGEDHIILSTNNNTERLRIDSSGRLIQRYSAAPYDNRAATFQSPAGQGQTYVAIVNTETNGSCGILFGDHAGQNAGNYDGYINYSHQYQMMQFMVGSGNERLRIDSSGRLLLNQTSAYSTNQMMIINGASPAGNVYNGQLMIQGSETNGSSDTGARINFAGHDGNTQRSWANITGAKENGTGGNQASYLSFHTRPDGGSPSERLRITSVGVIQTGSKTITGGNNLEIQNFAVKGVWSGSPSVGKSIELISGYDSAVKMAAIGYNLTDTNTGSTYGGDLTFHTQPLYSSPTTPLPVRMRISSSGYVTKPQQPGFEASYPDAYNTSNSPSNYVTQWLRVHHNYGSHFNANTGYFTAPVDGRYLFGTIWTNVGHSSPHCAFGINNGAASGPSRGGTNYTELWHTTSGSGSGLSPVHIFDLSANDTVNVWIYGFTGTADDPRAYFFGYLLA